MNFVFTRLFLWVIEHVYDLSTGVSENLCQIVDEFVFVVVKFVALTRTKKKKCLRQFYCVINAKRNAISSVLANSECCSKIIKVKKFVFVILKCKMIAKLHITCSVFNPAA